MKFKKHYHEKRVLKLGCVSAVMVTLNHKVLVHTLAVCEVYNYPAILPCTRDYNLIPKRQMVLMSSIPQKENNKNLNRKYFLVIYSTLLLRSRIFFV